MGLLEDIKRQNLELKMSMENFRVDNKTDDQCNSYDSYAKYLKSQLPSIHTLLSEGTGFKGNEEDFSDADTLDSTFDPGSMSSSDETYGTTEDSTSIINNASKYSTSREYPLVKAPVVSKSDDSRYNLRSRKTPRL